MVSSILIESLESQVGTLRSKIGDFGVVVVASAALPPLISPAGRRFVIRDGGHQNAVEKLSEKELAADAEQLSQTGSHRLGRSPSCEDCIK